MRLRISTFHRLVLALLVALCLHAPVRAQAQLPTRLVQASDLTYLGYFDLPDVPGNGDRRCFEYLYPGAMGINPGTRSLIIKSHDWDEGWAGEVNIPGTFGGTATLRTSCRDVTGGRIRQIPGEGNRRHIGGILVRGNDMLVSGFPYYANSTGDGTHMRRSANLTTGSVTGPVRVGNLSSGAIGGYMAHIPAAWQSALKGDMLTGQCCISRIQRSSFGPSVSSAWFNDVLTQNRPNATTLLFYPESNALEPYAPHGRVQLLFNGTTRIRGVVFPEGTASVLFFGKHGTGTTCYGEASACKDPSNGDHGEHAYPYQAQVWAYNAADLARVAAGSAQPHSVKPYAIWRLPNVGAEVAGAVIDGQRVYVLENLGDRPGRVHVFAVSGGSMTPTDPTPQPVDAVVSGWSAWTPVGQWSVCVAPGTQTRSEERTRTVVTPASNGGTTPALRETRVASQACTVPTPQPDPPVVITPEIRNLIAAEVERILAGWPQPKDGKDGAPGPAGPQGPRGESGAPGRDGTSVTLDQVRAIIRSELTTDRIIAALREALR